MENKESAEVYHLLGLAFYYQGFFQSAVKQLKQACQLKKDSEYLLNLSIVLNEIGQYKKAEAVYEEALCCNSRIREQEWKKSAAEKHFQTAVVYLKKEQLQSAVLEYLKALKLDPQNIQEHIQLAKLLWKLRKKNQAVEYLKNIISYSPQTAQAHLLLASWQIEDPSVSSMNVKEWEPVL